MKYINLYLTNAKLYSVTFNTNPPSSIDDFIITEITKTEEYYILTANSESQFFIITPPENFKLNKASPITINGDFEQLKVRTNTFYTDLNGFWVQLNPTEDTEGVETDYVTLQAYEEDTNYLNKRGLQTLYSIWKQDSNSYVQKTGDTMTGKLIVQNSIQEGYQTTASGNYSHTEGYQTTASGDYGAHAEGCETTASGTRSHAEGLNTLAAGEGAHAEGRDCQATGLQAHAEGAGAKASAQATHAEGNGTTASALGAHAENGNTTASGISSHAEGTYSTASGKASHSEGCKTVASGENSHSEGFFTKASGKNSHAEGTIIGTEHVLNGAKNTTTYTISGEVAIGQYILYNNPQSGINNKVCEILTTLYDSAQDLSTITVDTSLYSGKIIDTTVLVFWPDSNLASGESSHTEGGNTKSLGDYSHAEGYYTIASGTASHAEGYQGVAKGNYSHVDGIGHLAIGIGSHAEGGYSSAQTRTRDIVSISADRKTVVVTAESSLEESFIGCLIYQDSTKATVIAEEPETLQDQTKNWQKRTLTFDKPIPDSISSYFSLYKLGNATVGSSSHAEGQQTTAAGDFSHTEGFKTVARAEYSHAEGISTEARRSNQHVEGRFNIPDETSLHILGNGNYNSRSNAHTIAADGTAWFSGDIYTGSTSGTNKDTGSKKVATEDYVRNLLQEFATLNNLNMPS